MAKDDELPLVSKEYSSETLIEISSKGLGSLIVDKKKLIVFSTDGDLRRTLNNEKNPLEKRFRLL